MAVMVENAGLRQRVVRSAGEGEPSGKEDSVAKKLNYLHISILFGTPVLALYGILTTSCYWQTVVFSFLYYAFTGLGITAGYHRYWAHRAYDASLPVQIMLMLAGAGSVQGSIRWWCRDHRAHHRFTDTSKDPYNAKEGFFHSHLGWMLVKQDPKKIGRADIGDLNKDPIVRFQHKFYIPVALTMAFILPSIIAGYFWGDYRGGFFFAGILRLVFVHHSTFFVNSLAILGEHIPMMMSVRHATVC